MPYLIAVFPFLFWGCVFLSFVGLIEWLTDR